MAKTKSLHTIGEQSLHIGEKGTLSKNVPTQRIPCIYMCVFLYRFGQKWPDQTAVKLVQPFIFPHMNDSCMLNSSIEEK